MLTTKELSDAGVTRIVMPKTCTHHWAPQESIGPVERNSLIRAEHCWKCGALRPMPDRQLTDEQRTWLEQWNKACEKEYKL